MSNDIVVPVLGKESFNCPHCGALAHQTWFYAMVDSFSDKSGPWNPAKAAEIVKEMDAGEHREMVEFRSFFEKIASGVMFFDPQEQHSYLHDRLQNFSLSECFSCKKIALWVSDRLAFPTREYLIKPHDDMPPDVVVDFNEAAAIVEYSSRGAAALLRLAIEKLMPHLGEKGRLNEAIGSLVKKGLDSKIQKALDVVRVIGNNAVHPGQIDLKDDKDTATKLFSLVNLIVESQISTPKHIQALYDDLPQTALEGITKRDKAT